LLANVSRLLADRAIAGFRVRKDTVRQALDRNPILITALNGVIGYEKGAAIAKKAYRQGRPVLEVAQEETDLSEDELKQLLDPVALTQGGIKGSGGTGG
jgi:fumarate hydratase class II